MFDYDEVYYPDYEYKCNECGRAFVAPKKYVERHGFSYGPGEEFTECPYCGSGDYKEYHGNGSEEYVVRFKSGKEEKIFLDGEEDEAREYAEDNIEDGPILYLMGSFGPDVVIEDFSYLEEYED